MIGSMKVCEHCEKEHDSSYASGRFCNRSCANGWCTKARREEINLRVAILLKGKPQKQTDKRKHPSRVHITKEYLEKISQIHHLLEEKKAARNLELWKQGLIQPKEWGCKRLLVFEKGNKCWECGWSKTNIYTNTIPVEMDHIDGDCYNNRYENVRIVCPNCHSLTPTHKGANSRKGKGRIEYKVVSQWAKEKGISVYTGEPIDGGYPSGSRDSAVNREGEILTVGSNPTPPANFCASVTQW